MLERDRLNHLSQLVDTPGFAREFLVEYVRVLGGRQQDLLMSIVGQMDQNHVKALLLTTPYQVNLELLKDWVAQVVVETGWCYAIIERMNPLAVEQLLQGHGIQKNRLRDFWQTIEGAWEKTNLWKLEEALNLPRTICATLILGKGADSRVQIAGGNWLELFRTYSTVIEMGYIEMG